MLKSYIKVSSLSLIIGFYSGCSSKESSVTVPTNETQIESLETGIIVGGLLGHITGTSIVAGTVMGGIVGFSGGKILEEMQENYLDKENHLLKKIIKSVDTQQKLSYKINTLRGNISQLNRRINTLEASRSLLLSKNKLEVASKIRVKKYELLEFKKLNDSAIDDVLAYNNLVSYRKYPEDKKKNIESTLDHVLNNLFRLRKNCEYSLETLNNLEERI